MISEQLCNLPSFEKHFLAVPEIDEHGSSVLQASSDRHQVADEGLPHRIRMLDSEIAKVR